MTIQITLLLHLLPTVFPLAIFQLKHSSLRSEPLIHFCSSILRTDRIATYIVGIDSQTFPFMRVALQK